MAKLSSQLSPLLLLAGLLAVLSGAAGQDTHNATIRETIGNLIKAGFPSSDIGVLVDGTVFVGRDAVVTLEASREMLLPARPDPDQELSILQYRTRNQVSRNVRSICIDGTVLTGVLSQALNEAIQNYNEQRLSFRMIRRTFGCDATITFFLIAGSGGSAGFPTGGRPFSRVNIGVDTANFGLSVATHVITHELGHCIGFRHSDFFDRSISCGGAPVDEGPSFVGAIQIPGTPSGAVFDGSVMNSCFNQGSTGEWTDTDVTALRTLYGRRSLFPFSIGMSAAAANAPAASCVGKCGSMSKACSCEPACAVFKDCCSDFEAVCNIDEL